MEGIAEMDVLDVVGVLDRKEEERTSIPRVFRDRSVPFEALSDTEFRKDYRFTKPTFFKICGLLAEDLSHKTGRGSDLPVALQVCICIHLLGRNVMQSDSARIAGCNQTTVSRILDRFLCALNSKAEQFIYWPRGGEAMEIQRAFFQVQDSWNRGYNRRHTRSHYSSCGIGRRLRQQEELPQSECGRGS